MEPSAQKFNLLLLLPLVFLAILLGMGGYYLGFRQGLKGEQPSQAQPEEKSTKTIAEEELPIGISLLKNPIISQWQGTVKGKLVAKKEDSITIEDKVGNRITIPLRVSDSGEKPKFLASGVDLGSSTTRFSEVISGDISATPSARFVDLEEVPLNVDVQAEFYVRGDDKDEILGIDFLYFEGVSQ